MAYHPIKPIYTPGTPAISPQCLHCRVSTEHLAEIIDPRSPTPRLLFRGCYACLEARIMASRLNLAALDALQKALHVIVDPVSLPEVEAAAAAIRAALEGEMP